MHNKSNYGNRRNEYPTTEAKPTARHTLVAFTLGVLLTLIVVVVGAFLFTENRLYSNASYWMNIFTEVIGIGITVFLVDRINEWRIRQQSEKDLQEELIRRAASTSNEIAKDGIQALRYYRWLEGEKGLLKGKNLHSADLTGAVLVRANLQDVNLRKAKLQNADIRTANLQEVHAYRADFRKASIEETVLIEADLEEADLQYAHLDKCELQNACLLRAKLQNADLRGANLCGANLTDADLTGARLDGIMLDGRTILPNKAHWVSDIDLKQFTDTSHPNFWRSLDPDSPAYESR